MTAGPDRPHRRPPPGGPLRGRLPRYAAMFSLGVAAAAVAGAAWAAVTDASFAEGFAWSSWVIGVGLLLLGGLSGGGYIASSSGEHGVHYGRRHEGGLNSAGAEIDRARDLRDRLAAGLRPARNPDAFWQVVGGIGFVALGLVIVETFT